MSLFLMLARSSRRLPEMAKSEDVTLGPGSGVRALRVSVRYFTHRSSPIPPANDPLHPGAGARAPSPPAVHTRVARAMEHRGPPLTSARGERGGLPGLAARGAGPPDRRAPRSARRTPARPASRSGGSLTDTRARRAVEDSAATRPLAAADHESGGTRTPRGGVFVDPGRSYGLGFGSSGPVSAVSRGCRP